MSTIHIILPVHNGWEYTEKFVDCLRRQTHQDYRLILVDDGSTDGTAEQVRQRIEKLTVIRGKGKWWWGGGLQQGYLHIKRTALPADDLVLIINNDTEFGPEFLATADKIMAAERNCLLFAANYDRRTGELYDAGAKADWRSLRFPKNVPESEIDCLSSRGLFLRVGDLVKLGGFRPFFLPHYLSDYEFTIRARRRGYRLIVRPELNLLYDPAQGGHYLLAKEVVSFGDYLRKSFSLKTPVNPVIMTNFVVLSCPLPYLPLNILRVWGRFCGRTFGMFRRFYYYPARSRFRSSGFYRGWKRFQRRLGKKR